MKIKKKDIENLGKTITKNYLLFSKRIFKDTNFSLRLETLLNKYGDPTKTKSIIFSITSLKVLTDNNFEMAIKSTSAKSARKGPLIVDNFDRDEKLEFEKSISNFLADFDLGKEWEKSLITLVTTGEFYPPNRNFYVFGTIPDKKRVVITLNPDTSLEDLANNWNLIRAFQKHLWPDFKKTNFTKKSMTIFKNVFGAEMLRIAEADKKNQKQISGNYFEQMDYDFSNVKKSEKTINKKRTVGRQTGEKHARPVKFIKRLSLKRVTKKNYKVDQKNYNTLIQQRKRLRN